ncbi:type I site specific restriction modification protein [Caudoviricetes sp.]|nr:type I site specific restriction modification protein [Caudoviricetes sp.]
MAGALQLFDYQESVISGLREGFAAGHQCQMLVAPTGGGKCLGRDTSVMLANGLVVPVQDVRVGDFLMGPDGKPRAVLSVCSGREILYKVTPKKGDPYIVNASHILSLKKTTGSDGLVFADGLRVKKTSDIVNVNVVTFANSNKTTRHCLKGWRSDAIDSFLRDEDADKKARILPSYILGAWLGDGSQGCAVITKPPCKMVDEWAEYGRSMGYGCKNQSPDGDCPSWRLTNGRGTGENRIQDALDAIGVLRLKHVPDAYKFGPIDVRLEVLAGLIDSDGSLSHGGIDWVSKSERLAHDFAFMCRSVGLSCYLSKQRKTIKKTGFEGWYWRASVSGDLSILPMRDKIAPKRRQKKRHLVHSIEIEEIGEGDYYGFEIDGDRLFLLGDFTATHNTEMAMALLVAAAQRGNRAAMLLDRIVLCEQTSARLDKYGLDHGVMQSGHWRYRPYERIQVCSAQTIEKRGSFPGLKLLIVDEAHQTRKQTVEFIRANPDIKVVGLSATPFAEGLGQIYTNVVSSISTGELVQRGRLCPLRVYIAKEIDMTGVKLIAGEWSQKEATERGQLIVGDVVAEWVAKTHEVFGGPRKTIVFCAGVEHGATLAKKFAEAGYNFVNLSYKDDDDYKRDAIADFAKKDTKIHGLIATDILTKGFDVPDTMIGVSARPFSKSLSSHVQQMGRVMRASEGKEFALWLDHSGNYLRFREDWDEVFANGVTDLDKGEKPKKEKTEKEKQAAKCPKCGLLWPADTDTCPACGHIRHRKNQVSAVPGSLTALDGGSGGIYVPNGEQRERQRWHAELLNIQESRGYKSGWAAANYRDRFGIWPPRVNVPSPSPVVSRDVKAWVRAKAVEFAKGIGR